MSLLPSQLALLEDAAIDILADLASSGATTDEATLCRTLHRVTGIRLAPSDPMIDELLGRVGLRSWEDRGVVLTALITAGAPSGAPSDAKTDAPSDAPRTTRSFAEVAHAVGLLAGPADTDSREVAEAAAAHRDIIWARRR